MAKGNRTTSKRRAQTVAKATKRRPPVEWGVDDTGQQIVTRARGRWTFDLPVARLRYLRNIIDDMAQVVKAIDCAAALQGDAKHTMLFMSASVGRCLMLDAADNMRAVLALSPALREAVAREDARMAKSEGGAA